MIDAKELSSFISSNQNIKYFEISNIFSLSASPKFANNVFIVSSSLLSKTEIIDHCIEIILSLFGRFRGGAAYVNILGSLIFAGMTGSALADASGLGMIEINQMKKNNEQLLFFEIMK